MERDAALDPDKDDLPLSANTNHIRVKHYVLDLTVHIDSRVIAGSIVLFLEPTASTASSPGDKGVAADADKTRAESRCTHDGHHVDTAQVEHWTGASAGECAVGRRGLGTEIICSGAHNMEGHDEKHTAEIGQIFGAGDDGCMSHALSGVNAQPGAGADCVPFHTDESWESTSDSDFTLVLDCCDLTVSKVEELDVTSVPAVLTVSEEVSAERSGVSPVSQSADLIHKLLSMPSGQWRRQHQLFSQCSRAPVCQSGGSIPFCTDRWSLQVRKRGVRTPQDFPRALRVCYQTRHKGASVRWTRDQDNRACVYTAGSPINNRALFPCQEPPLAMATWQARVRAPSECVVLMSGENQATPTEDGESGLLLWEYYVTMPMPASTFTLAVGSWRQATAELSPGPERGTKGWIESGEAAKPGAEAGATSRPGSSSRRAVEARTLSAGSGVPVIPSDATLCHSPSASASADVVDDSSSCSHGDYPCRFTERSARFQRVVPHRVFAPECLLQMAQVQVLSLLPCCLAAAHDILGVHPFPRIDVLIVPAGFSSLGMASPHIAFLSQSVLGAGGPRSAEAGRSLCGSRLCHELAHSWFGLAIGARDWTEEWLSEGFATYLEDVIWARAQQLSPGDTEDQSNLKALLRWRRLSDELQNSEEELQILRPNMESTGLGSESGSSVVKHALNPDKTFMQVHYLKGYFLLRFLASEVGEQHFVNFFRTFVNKYHGQLILSQDFLHMLLFTFPDLARKGLTLCAIYADWLDRPGIPKIWRRGMMKASGRLFRTPVFSWLYESSAVWSQARLVEEVKAEVVKWTLHSQSHGHGGKRKRVKPNVNYRELTSDQLVLLQEFLLDVETLSGATLQLLQRAYSLQQRDAEVRHRWCELVVKHGHSQAYRDVEHFLVHDQAMGVYLYGELMVQEDTRQQALARRCLSLVQEEMDQSACRVVEEMVL